MNKLFLPIGMIGSGKSTWAKKQNPNVQIVAGDNIRYMLNGGEYIYNERLEPVVKEILFNATMRLLNAGYDVILDECYCCLSKQQRREVAQRFRNVTLIAVTFPEKGMEDRIEDKKIKGLRGKTIAYWKRVFQEMAEIYEPFDHNEEYYFDQVVNAV